MTRALLLCLLLALPGCATWEQTMSSDEAAIGCQAADAITTYVVLSKVASVHEANPLMAEIIKAGGWPLFFIVKAAMAWWLTNDDINPTVKAGINTVTCGIAASNVAVGIGALQ